MMKIKMALFKMMTFLSLNNTDSCNSYFKCKVVLKMIDVSSVNFISSESKHTNLLLCIQAPYH